MQRYSHIDAKVLLEMSDEDLRLVFFVVAELNQVIVFPMASARAGRRVASTFAVLDFKGVSVVKTYFRLKRVLKVMTHVLFDFFPETMHKLVIVNAGILGGAFFWGVARVC